MTFDNTELLDCCQAEFAPVVGHRGGHRVLGGDVAEESPHFGSRACACVRVLPWQDAET